MTIEWVFPVILTKSSMPLSIYVVLLFQYPKAKAFKFTLQMRKLLTLHSNAFLWPVFHLSGKDSTGPHTDHAVSHVELQRVKAKHFNPEKPNFHRRVRALEYQRHLQGNASWQYLLLGTCQGNGIKDHIMHALALLKPHKYSILLPVSKAVSLIKLQHDQSFLKNPFCVFWLLLNVFRVMEH